MRNETKVSLAGICNVLQNAKKYDDPDRAFKVLWDGWRAQGLRHKMLKEGMYLIAHAWCSLSIIIEMNRISAYSKPSIGVRKIVITT